MDISGTRIAVSVRELPKLRRLMGGFITPLCKKYLPPRRWCRSGARLVILRTVQEVVGQGGKAATVVTAATGSLYKILPLKAQSPCIKNIIRDVNITKRRFHHVWV